jgi:hypothetical protein
MNANAVAFIAAPYGFGPSSKAIAISSYLPRSLHRVFFSDGPPLEMAQRSQEFSNCFRLDFEASKDSAVQLLSTYSTLVFVNTTRFITASPQSGQSIILVETLGWLRGSPPACSHLKFDRKRLLLRLWVDLPIEINNPRRGRTGSPAEFAETANIRGGTVT